MIYRCGHCRAASNMHCNLEESCGYCGRPMFESVKVLAHVDTKHVDVELETTQLFIGPMACLDGMVTGLEYHGKPVFLSEKGELFLRDKEARRLMANMTDPVTMPEFEEARLAEDKVLGARREF
jgi:hypothetical protein